MIEREPGMYDSDRCRFCHDFWFKARPYVCVDCFARAAELMKSEGWHAPNVAQNNGWIAIAAEAPPRGQPILLCCERGTTAIGWACEDGELETDLPRGIEFEPLWWQQLPGAPTVEKAE